MVDPLKTWSFCYFLHYFIHFMSKKYAKSGFRVKKLISTSKQRAEHPLAGQNTQQMTFQVERFCISDVERVASHVRQKPLLN